MKFTFFQKSKVQPAKTRSVKEVVEEIHETFNTEVDRLLEQANITKSTAELCPTEKANVLMELGFSGTQEVKRSKEATKRLNESKETIEAIRYYSQKYPTYKFITEQSVIRICEKYGLVYGTVDRYLGEVPDKNLEDMKAFKIDPADECYGEFYDWSRRREPYQFRNLQYIKEELADRKKMSQLGISIPSHNRIEKLPLEIAAPKKDFNTEGMSIRNNRISYPDPVVLQPVYFKGKKHYLIITAWGAEASDENIVNEKMN